MKRNIFLSAVIMIAMIMASVNANAQGRGRGYAGSRTHREMQIRNAAPIHHHYGRVDVVHRPHHAIAPVPVHHHAGHVVLAGGHRLDHRGFLPGWEGRVRYLDGRWGYLRDSRWYWYDTYFEPEFYFAHRPHYFRAHYVPVDGRVVAGVAGAVAVGTLIAALCH